MNMMNNFALIIGAMKCGTTSLFSYLAQHPQISPCSKKEPNFFSNDLNWSKGFDCYQSLWDWDSTAHKFAMEASVNYTKAHHFIHTTDRILSLKEQGVNFKFIYIMRNPLDRIESHYTHGQAMSWKSTIKPISEGINRHLIETSRYAKQIEVYYQKFSADSILLLNFDDLKADPHSIIRKLCRFLDVDPDYKFEGIDTIHNANKQRIVYANSWRSLRRNKLLRSLAGLISTKQKEMFRDLLFSHQLEEKIKLSPEQRNFLLQELREDLRKLNSEYGVDIRSWGIEL
jgi:hypothetical protein